ncbi:unnamed protein product [Blepharisma stoltei]|uniref:Microtubule-associated protein RP/EB family member 1 n=1 Tax=Blepharisma stoltei TaxID=1481888 RepID=A0AAU9JB83_9CILI|nr:unnamed protein product [Blepharisma stoltei]
MSSTDSFGTIDSSSSVSKNDLLHWLNDFFKLNIAKVEHLASGSAYCQIIESIYPGQVQMHKVNWKAKHEYEFINNFKVLQQAFTRCSIQKYIEVEKLVKGKFQDNLEFLQWIKKFFDAHYNGASYEPAPRRRPPSRQSTPDTKRPVKKVLGEHNSQVSPIEPVKVKLETDEMRMTIHTLEKERDYYFGKLRDIENFIQKYEDQEHPVIASIQKILYAAGDDAMEIDQA